METSAIYGVLWIIITLAVVSGAALFSRLKGPDVLIAAYTGLVVISVTTATKLITFFGVTVPAGVIVYSASFLVTDIISEIYGKEKAQTAVWAGFSAMILFFMYSYVTVIWPKAPYWELQKSYEDIMGLSTRVAFAGAIAFIFSQLTDVIIFHMLKKRHGQDKLYIRNNVSTWISQLLDTTVFISIAFYGLFPIGQLIVSQYSVKIFIALVDTPFLYAARKVLANNSRKA